MAGIFINPALGPLNYRAPPDRGHERIGRKAEEWCDQSGINGHCFGSSRPAGVRLGGGNSGRFVFRHGILPAWDGAH
jgi:hypothetical protein